MKPRHALSTTVRALVLLCSPLPMSAAGAAVAPAPTLVRFDPRTIDRPTPLSDAVNSCVSLITAHDLAAASTACDTAVSLARHPHSQETTDFADRPLRTRDLAIAYNDRAVLHYLAGEIGLASDDSTRALDAKRTSATEATAAAVRAKKKRLGLE
jgi:hypothetical protein